jgi:hypothetical protein
MVLCGGALGVKVEKPPGPDADRGRLPIGGGHWRVYRLGPNEGRAASEDESYGEQRRRSDPREDRQRGE